MRSYFKGIVILCLLLGIIFGVVGCKEESNLCTLNLIIKNKEDKEIKAEVLLLKDGQLIDKEEGSKVQFDNLESGQYELKVKKEGYILIEEEILLKGETLNGEVELEEINKKGKEGEEDYWLWKVFGVGEKENEDKDRSKNESTNLEIVVKDRNSNSLNVKVIMLKNGEILRSSEGSEVEFENLVPGEYQLKIIKEGYKSAYKDLIINNKKKELKVLVQLNVGSIKEEIINLKDKKRIKIFDLTEDEEVIVGLTPLGLTGEKPVEVEVDFRVSYCNYSAQRPDIEEDNLIDIKYDFDFEEGLENELRKKEQESVISGDKIKKSREDVEEYGFYQEEEFHVPDLVSTIGKEDNIVKAKMVGAAEHIYIFVDSRIDLPLININDIAKEFENNIYPTLTTKFGKPSDVDNNGRIILLLTKFNNYKTSGLFYSEDLKNDLSGSNFNDIIYLNIDKGIGRNLYPALAHQFQHLIFYNQKIRVKRRVDDVWVNEGLAKLAEKICGYIDYGREGWSWQNGNNWVYSESVNYPGYFMMTDKISLLEEELSIPYLGAVGLFMDYLYEKYGVELLQALINTADNPKQVVEEFAGSTFDKVLLNWTVANVVDANSQIDNPIYNYQTFDLVKEPKMVEINNDCDLTFQIKELGTKYIKLSGQNSDIKLSLNGIKDKKIGLVIIRKKRESKQEVAM